LVITLVGCSEASRVSDNLSQEADNFNVTRILTVINVRTDTVLYQMTGNFSINIDSDGDLDVIGENPNGTYYKHFVRIPPEITYIVQDLGTTTVSKHQYEINFNPDMILPAKPVTID
jgi:basic membrane lipoprotein Med (substrate-binding protein (PBP1-ABC) superfamily)